MSPRLNHPPTHTQLLATRTHPLFVECACSFEFLTLPLPPPHLHTPAQKIDARRAQPDDQPVVQRHYSLSPSLVGVGWLRAGLALPLALPSLWPLPHSPPISRRRFELVALSLGRHVPTPLFHVDFLSSWSHSAHPCHPLSLERVATRTLGSWPHAHMLFHCQRFELVATHTQLLVAHPSPLFHVDVATRTLGSWPYPPSHDV
jgi:hypothetical protein